MHKLQAATIKAGKLGHYVDDLVSRNSSYYQRWLSAEGDVSNANLSRATDSYVEQADAVARVKSA